MGKISVDTLNNISLIYGDFAIVRPDLCFEGLGSLHPSVTYIESATMYSTWFIHGKPDAPIIDTFSRIAFANLPIIGQKITVDFNKTTSIKNMSKTNICIFPNPASQILNIQGLTDFSGSLFHIISLDGRAIFHGKVEENKIGVQKLKTGNYILKISNKGHTYYARFIKTDQ